MTRDNKGHELRNQLLREVGQERQQCLALADGAARKRTALNYSAVDITVTVPKNEVCTPSGFGYKDHDAVHGLRNPSQDTSGCLLKGTLGRSGPTSVPGHGALGWNAEDDIAQADALRALRRLGEQSRRTGELEVMLKEQSPQTGASQEELLALKSQVSSLQEALAKEWEQQAFMSQQMECLEKELDAKEVTINDLEEDLDSKVEQLSRMQRDQKQVADNDARIKSLELQLHDRDQQLEAKDGHIMRLLSVLRQHRSSFLDDTLEGLRVCPDGTIKVC